MSSTLRAFKVVLFLCLANDAGNAGAVGVAAAKHRHRPVAPSAAGCPNNAADIDIGNLPRQLRDCIDALLNKRLQLLGGTSGLQRSTIAGFVGHSDKVGSDDLCYGNNFSRLRNVSRSLHVGDDLSGSFHLFFGENLRFAQQSNDVGVEGRTGGHLYFSPKATV